MKKLLLVLLVVSATFAAFGESQIFVWKDQGTTFRSFGDSANWTVGGGDATTYPGTEDWIEVSSKNANQNFTLDNEDYTVKGMHWTTWDGDYSTRYMKFKDGSLTFTDDFYNRRVHAEILSGGKFVIGSSCSARFGWNGAENQYVIWDGGEFDVYGSMSIGSLQITCKSGGTVVFDPQELLLWDESYTEPYSSFDNSGTMSFPNGLDFKPTSKRTAANANETRFLQKAGTMTFGGPISIDPKCYGSFTFDLSGGTLEIQGDVSMTDFQSVGMATANATATIDLAEGKTLDWSKAVFAAGTTLNLTGSGKIILGVSFPGTLNKADTVTLERTLIISGAGQVIDDLPGWETSDLIVEMDFNHFPTSPLFTSANAGLLAKYFAALQPLIPAGWTCEIQGNSVVVTARPPATFCWKGGASVRAFGAAEYWSLAATEDAPRENPYNVIPGPTDLILYGIGAVYKKFYFDLGGEEHSVSGFAGDGANWNYHDASFANGTLTFVDSFSNYYIQGPVKDGGKLVLAATSTSRLGYSGACNNLTVEAGGEIDYLGAIEIAHAITTVNEGGKVVLDPTDIGFHPETTGGGSYLGQGVFNSGTLELPNGLAMHGAANPVDSAKKTPPVYTLRNTATGTLVLGGDIALTSGPGVLNLELEGGSLNVTDDAAISWSVAASVAANATVDVTIADGKTFDVSHLAFGAGSTANVSGGSLVLGASMPTTLALDAVAEIRFAAGGVTLGAITGIGETTFGVEESALVDGAVLVYSSDAALLETIAAGLVLPSGWKKTVEDGAIKLAKTGLDRPSFTCSGERNLSEACWDPEGPAFSEGAAIYVSGEETVAVLDSTSPSISRITVRNGATLKIAESVTELPEFEAAYDAKIVIAANMAMPAVTAVANQAQIPVVEIPTGVVVTVAANYEFKNVRLDFFGEIQPQGDIWFGTAEAGETTYFGMRWMGGTLNYPGNGTLSIVCPKAQGGRVVCPDGIYLQGTKFLPLYTNYFGFNVGYLNPTDEPFTMTIDGCYLDLRGNRHLYFAGAAKIRCVNGGGLFKHDAWSSYGLYGQVIFQDRATVELEDGSYIYYTYNQNNPSGTVYFSPAEQGFEELVMKNGSYFAVHSPSGNGKTSVRAEDAYYDVMQLQKDVDKVGRRDWYYDAFNKFTVITVPDGKFFGMRSSKAYVNGVDWDRELAIGAPIAGGGSLIVTNATPGHSMRAIVKLGTNTATGEAKAFASDDGCQLVFADGSNWAGTLVANEDIAFTNLTDGAAAANVSVGNVRFEGPLALRVWKQTGASDRIDIAGTLSRTKRNAGFCAVCMDGEIANGDSFEIGTCLASALPADYERALTARGWALSTTPAGDGKVTLTITRSPMGGLLLVR